MGIESRAAAEKASASAADAISFKLRSLSSRTGASGVVGAEDAAKAPGGVLDALPVPPAVPPTMCGRPPASAGSGSESDGRSSMSSLHIWSAVVRNGVEVRSGLPQPSP